MNKLPNKADPISKTPKTNKSKLLESKDRDVGESKPENNTTLKKNIASKSKLTIEHRESENKKAGTKADLSFDRLEKITPNKSLNGTVKMNNKNSENDLKKKEGDPKTPTKRQPNTIHKTDSNLKGKSPLKVVKPEVKGSGDKTTVSKPAPNNKKEIALEVKNKSKATLVTPAKKDAKGTKKTLAEMKSTSEINGEEAKIEKTHVEVEKLLVESFVEKVDITTNQVNNLEEAINHNIEEKINENEVDDAIQQAELFHEKIENDGATA
jgi:hypothetical protein